MTLVHPRVDPTDVARPEAEALIREARSLRRRRWTIGIVVVGVLVGTGVGWDVAAHSRGRSRPGKATVTPPPITIRPGWHAVGTPPYAQAVAAVRAGDQVVVAFGPSHLRFAAFDPVAQRWAKLPAPPLDLQAPFTDSPTFANIGESILVWGHAQVGDDTSSGSMRVMAYSLATRTWRVLPESPIHSLIQATPIWTGKELIVWGGDGVTNVAAAFDPSTQQWHALPAGPLHPHEDPVAVWTGREMIIWGGFRVENPPDPAEGAAFNPLTNTWRVLPSSGLSNREVGATAWTGTLFVVWSGSASGNGPVDPNDGAAYDPATNRWHQIAAAPIAGRELASFAWTGRSLFVWGGISFTHARQTLQDGAMYDPATNKWIGLPTAPLVSRWGAVAIWTGNDVLLVDGYGPSSPHAPSEPAITGAAVYRPS